MSLFSCGKKKQTCKVCDNYRKQTKKPNALESFVRFEVLYLHRWHNASLVDRGMYRCVDCCVVVDASKEKFSRNCNRCYDCFREWHNGYKRAARHSKTEDPEVKRKAALADAEKSSRLAERNAIEAFQYHVKEKASDDWVERYFKAQGMPWRNPRLSEAERKRVRYHSDKEYALKERMRRQINKAAKKDGVADLMRRAIKQAGKSNKVESTLGYSIADLKAHIEKQFTKGMSWGAFKDGQIHIDHIVPQACFDLSNPNEWLECWSLSNLRPCWAGDNWSKSAKRLHLL